MNFLKQFLRKLVKALFFLMYCLPRKIQYFIGVILGVMWFDVIRLRRKVIFDNLDLAFPEMSKKEKTKIGRASCVNLGMTYIEFMRMRFMSKKNLDEFKFYGLENIKKAEEKGKGVCLLTLHLANGDYACAGLALNDVKVALISKEFKAKWINEAWFSIRKRFGTTFIRPKRSSYDILKSLKNKQRVVFVMDQFMHPPSGVKTTFFGHSTRSSPGLAVMAQRSGAPVVPIYAYRNKEGITEIHCTEEIPFVEKEDKQESINTMSQVYQDKLEEFVRLHPDQWMWVHKRWKPY